MKKTRLDEWICQVEGCRELTGESLRQLQLRKLNELLKREHARQGFYRDLPASVESLAELETLPFTTPGMLSERGTGMLLVSQGEVARVISGITSGTTGPAKRLFYTERDIAHTVGFFAAGIGEMAGPGDKVLIEMPFSGPFGLGDLIEKAVLSLGAVPIRGIPDGTFKERAEQMRQEQPDSLIGMPVPLLGLLRFMKREEISCPLKSALVSADACPEGVMGALSAVGLSLFPHYGSREMCLGGAITCPAHEGMHLRENHVLAEIVDEKGTPLPDGEWGELVITTLDMEAFPVIRYRTGDRARFLPGRCACGGVTRRLDKVSRLRQEEGAAGQRPDMEEWDSSLFRALPELLDLYVSEGNAPGDLPGACQEEGSEEGETKLCLKLLLTEDHPEIRERAEAAARNLLPAEVHLEYRFAVATGEEKGFYRGKRRVE